MNVNRSLPEPPSAFAVYVFRDLARANPPGKRKRLHWLRAAVCPDLASAMLRAELIRAEPGVRRVQVFEQRRDGDGNAVAGRIVRTLGHPRLALFQSI